MKTKNAWLPDVPLRITKDLSPSEKFVLVYIKQHIGGNIFSHVSTEALAEETGYSRQTVSKCIAVLERKGWLTVQRRNRKSSFYSLIPEKFRWPSKCDYVKPVDNNVYTTFTAECKPALQEVYRTKKENQESESSAGEPAQQANQSNYSEPPGENKKTNNITPGNNGNKVTIKTLESIWQSTIQKVYYESKHVLNSTVRERGQLSHFIRKVEPFKNPLTVMKHALDEWIDFSTVVERDKGLHTSPGKPHIGFILKHCENAVNFSNTVEERIAQHEAQRQVLLGYRRQQEIQREEQLLKYSQYEEDEKIRIKEQLELCAVREEEERQARTMKSDSPSIHCVQDDFDNFDDIPDYEELLEKKYSSEGR